VKLPRSPPWDAPEYRASREWAHSQAAKLDIFSYGLLCFWLLFEPRLSQNESFSPDCGAGSVIVHTSTLKTLERIKNNHQIGLYVRECLEAESTLDETRRRDVQEFLRRSLMENPQEREADLRCLLQMLDERL
jgi:hypothetical protein